MLNSSILSKAIRKCLGRTWLITPPRINRQRSLRLNGCRDRKRPVAFPNSGQPRAAERPRASSADPAATRSRGSGRKRGDVVNLDGSVQTLQHGFAHRLGGDPTFHLGPDPLRDQHLPRLRLVAPARGQVAHGADGGIAGAISKADLSQRRVALSDAGTKAQLTVASTPGGDQKLLFQ